MPDLVPTRMNVPRKRYTLEVEVPLRMGVTADGLLSLIHAALAGNRVPSQQQVVSTVVLNADGSEGPK